MEESRNKLEKAESNAKALLDQACFVAQERRASAAAQPPTKRVKTRSAGQLPAEAAALTHEVEYRYTMGDVIRTRRVVSGLAAQACAQRIQSVLLPTTLDLDVENCAFTIWHQLIQKLDPQPPMPPALWEVLESCALNRAKVCDDYLKFPECHGKKILLPVLQGASLPEAFEDNEFLKKLQKVSLYLRWLAMSALPDVHDLIKLDEKRPFPESSVLYYMWSAVEDYILSAWARHCQTKEPPHLSLHYDGIRISKDAVSPLASFLESSISHIKTSTGFDVRIREKKHALLFDTWKEQSAFQSKVKTMPDALAKDGNCILAAIWWLLPEKRGDIEAYLEDTKSPANVAAASRRSRSYAEVMRALGIQLVPVVTDPLVLQTGNHIAHAECDGNPHCVAVVRSADAQEDLRVNDLDDVLRITPHTFELSLATALDRRSAVFFNVFVDEKHAVWPDEPATADLKILDSLQAGGKRPAASSRIADTDETEATSSDSDGTEVYEADEAVVRVTADLLARLETEVSETLAAVRQWGYQPTGDCFRCVLCPFRVFMGTQHKDRLVRHLRQHHNADHTFCCGNSKQLRIVKAIYNDDLLKGDVGRHVYIRCSAVWMASTITPALDPGHNYTDRDIRLVFTDNGPGVSQPELAGTHTAGASRRQPALHQRLR